MPTPVHDCKPIWTAIGVRATCNTHFWQPIDRSSKTAVSVTR